MKDWPQLKSWLSTLTSSLNAPLHIILRRFKLLPILVLLFFMVLTWDIHLFYKLHAFEFVEWQVIPLLGYLGTLIATIKYCLDAARKGEEMDTHDK